VRRGATEEQRFLALVQIELAPYSAMLPHDQVTRVETELTELLPNPLASQCLGFMGQRYKREQQRQ